MAKEAFKAMAKDLKEYKSQLENVDLSDETIEQMLIDYHRNITSAIITRQMSEDMQNQFKKMFNQQSEFNLH